MMKRLLAALAITLAVAIVFVAPAVGQDLYEPTPIAEPAMVSGTFWCDSDGDGVRGAGETSLAGHIALLFVRGPDGAWVSAASDSGSEQTTDEAGHLEFSNVEPGDYRIALIVADDCKQLEASALANGLALPPGTDLGKVYVLGLTISGTTPTVFNAPVVPAVAAATTAQSAGLAFTGSSTTEPLLIGGGLVLVIGSLLIGARRRVGEEI